MSTQPLPSVVIDEDGRTVNRDDLGRDVAAVAAGMARRGIKAGDRVVVSLPNSYAFVVVHLAVDLLNAVTVQLPTAFRREVGQVIRMVDARFTVLGDIEDPHAYGDLREYVRLPDDELGDLRGDPRELTVPTRRDADKTWLAFTAGSTGTPRAAVHTRRSLEASTAAMGDRYGIGADDTVLAAAPAGHAIGFCYAVRLACARGARLVLQRSWSAERAAELISRERCTFAAVPTPFLNDLVERGASIDNALRHLLVGGAPVSRDDLARADQLFGPRIASAYYGASECGAVLSVPPDADDDARHRTEGVPMPGMEVRVVDAEGGECAPGVQGELLVRGPQVATGYWMNNDSDRQFLPDGWFATRDLVIRHDTGFVSVTGRMKDIIIRGAVNIVPSEVEEALSGYDRVRRAVVLGIPDAGLGERIVAAVLPRGDAPTRGELRDWLRDCGLAHYKWPDDVFHVDELPTNAAGKIDRSRIREDLSARIAAGE